ncbi:MAG TPA: hypothetical protein VJZ27_08615, partial [Aggregatilineales bacterium]|nr:hypothetical protein [Aggregatilineales bacterium]
YEVRRELIRARKNTGLRRLDVLVSSTLIHYSPITTQVMRKAAEFWAQARQQGTPTADPRALDGDVILAAQAAVLTDEGNSALIATTNVGHLALFVDAKHWKDIQ